MQKTGGCLCGAVRFECALTNGDVVCCHCTQCRRQSGNFWSAALALKRNLTIAAPESVAWRRQTPDAERGFCRDCGAFLFWRADDEDEVSIAAGALDDDAELKVVAHIFVADKGAYYDLPPGVPRYARGRSEPPIDS